MVRPNEPLSNLVCSSSVFTVMKSFPFAASLALISCTLPYASTGLAAEEWPQWRGPTRDGKVSGDSWPANFSGIKEIWRVALGKSYSGPVVSGGKIFTTESIDKTYEQVRAFDAATGKELWTHQWEGFQKVPFFAASNGDWVRSTPATDGKFLFVGGMRDMLLALDAASGQEKWRVDFVAANQAAPPAFGFVCSPLVQGDSVYVQAGGGFCRVEKATGKVLWTSLKDGGGMNGSAFSSPMPLTLAGVPQLVVQTREELCGVGTDGTVYWREKIPSFRGMNILTPVASGNTVFTSSYGGKTLALKLTKEGTALKQSLSWEHKAEGYMSSPVIIAGKVFLHLRNQRFSCFDLATGTQHWVTEEKFGKYMSLVAQGSRILALDERGMLLLINATPEKFDLVAQHKLPSSDTWAHLAAVGNRLYIRELQALTALEWK